MGKTQLNLAPTLFRYLSNCIPRNYRGYRWGRNSALFQVNYDAKNSEISDAYVF
jgi:hypothetical protein